MRLTLHASLVVLLLYAGVDGKLVSLLKPVTMSSISNNAIIGNGQGYHMVDGDKRRNTTGCKCCSVTKHTSFTNDFTPWYRLDLGKDYVIEKIEILGRLDTGTHQNIGNVTISVTNSVGTTVFSDHTPNEAIFTYDVTLPQLVTGQIIFLQKTWEGGHFTICELSVYGACGHGRFGQDCGQSCGQCKDMVTCDIGDGTCSDGCDRGYKGTLCNQPCTDRTYGYNCGKACGHCKDGGPCDTKDGRCPSGCEPGYTSDRCNEVCNSGYFGEDCNSTCGFCTDGATCDHINGTCTSCVPWYLTVFCNHSCAPGQYGVGCAMNCSGNCVNGSQCNFTTGTCDEGCTDGYTGDTCLIDVTNQQGGGQTDEPPSSVWSIVGAVIGVVVIAAVVIVIVVLAIRRRRNQQDGGGKQPGFSSVITGEPGRRRNVPAPGIPQYAQVIKKPGGGVGMKVEDTHMAKSELNGQEPPPTGGDILGVKIADAGAGQGDKLDPNGKDTNPKFDQLQDILKSKVKGDKSSLQKDTAGSSNDYEFPHLLKIGAVLGHL